MRRARSIISSSDWEGTKLDLICRLMRSTIWRLAKSLGEKSIYHSGLQIIDAIGDSYEKLRQLIAERIIRALEEQKANAARHPAARRVHVPAGKGDLYRRCEFLDGQWRKQKRRARNSRPRASRSPRTWSRSTSTFSAARGDDDRRGPAPDADAGGAVDQ
jgi:hypothetical protein